MVLPALRTFFTMQPAPIPERTERAYVVGPAAVDPGQQYFGVDPAVYQPQEYANYIATSNGVYACVSLRARTLAHLQLKVYRVSGADKRTEITSGPLWELLQKVNPYWTSARLLDMTEQSLCTWGAGYWFMEKQGRTPKEIWWARPDRVTVHPHPNDYISHFTYKGPSGTEIRYERDETVWFRFPNVADQYSGLSPMAAARLAADTYSAAMHSNHNIFRNGVQMSGVFTPKGGVPLTKEQARDISDNMDRRFKGVDKAHRIGVLIHDVDFKSVSMSPKDAEFLGALNWSLEDIARAFNVPIDKVGGKRTYQNVQDAETVFWSDCMKPEAQFIANEITEQLLPMFGDNLIAEFDLSEIAALQEAESEVWAREREQIDRGALTLNEWRVDHGMDPVAWGDVAWLQSTLMPIDSPEKPAPIMPPALAAGSQDDDNEDEDTPAGDEQRSRSYSRELAYGSDEHRRLWDSYVAKTTPYETQWGRMTADLFNAQKQSILSQLYRAAGRSMQRDDTPPALAEQIEAIAAVELTEAVKAKLDALADAPFDRARWIKAFRVEGRELTTTITEAMGQLAANEVGLATGFHVKDPNIIRGIEAQAQRFAEEVNATTWDKLKTSLQEGIRDGDGVDAMAKRVEDVMGDRIRSSAQVIARTEVTRATNFGTIEGWRQSGVVSKKRWLAALDSRTRATHVEAHGQTVGLDDDFEVGGCTGPGPGNLDCAREVANCRCALTAVLDVE